MADALGFSWNGTAMVPLPHFQRRWRDGRTYWFRESRSPETHNHQFAWLADALLNLPEHYKDRFATPEHLRKWALIKTGFRDERIVHFSSHEDALRAAALVGAMDDFAVVVVTGNIVTIYTAKSQSEVAMGKEDFQASKQAVLEEIASMIGVAPEVMGGQSRHKRTRERKPRQIESPSIVTDHARQDEAALARIGRGKVGAS